MTDLRFLQIVGQIIFLILVVVALSALVNSILGALAARNLTPNFVFLDSRAGFELAGAGDYTPNDSYWAAFGVGLRNTLTVVIAGLVGATIVGILVGIFLLSGNWLVRTISRVYVEILRNTPLLVQIVVVFFVGVLALPIPRASIQVPAEGIVPIPLRLVVYAAALFFGARAVRGLAAADWRARMTLPMLVGAILYVEFGFARAMSGLNIPYLIALAVGMIVVALAWRGSSGGRFTLIGILIGQMSGVLLVAAGVVPNAVLRIELQPVFYLNNRGFFYPTLLPTGRFAVWALFVVLGVVVAAAQSIYFGRIKELTGEIQPRTLYAITAILAFALIGWIIVGAQPIPSLIPVVQDGFGTLLAPDAARENGLLTLDDELQIAPQPVIASVPRPRGLRFEGGASLSPGYIALLIALVIYTSAFIAEIVRAGILAVPRGQLEASRALGFTYGQTLRMVILPQALRVIIPPLGNQYLNLAKNSSLAIAVAYPDIYAVTGTIINQTGQAVPGIVLIMLSYLIISLIIAAGMNAINRRFQIVTR
ncbi:MAG: ABC transporter permease subunit [Chloroflexota bacterium]|nr:ABC transporter permease subunit [Chloroflexota bacterium]